MSVNQVLQFRKLQAKLEACKEKKKAMGGIFDKMNFRRIELEQEVSKLTKERDSHIQRATVAEQALLQRHAEKAAENARIQEDLRAMPTVPTSSPQAAAAAAAPAPVLPLALVGEYRTDDLTKCNGNLHTKTDEDLADCYSKIHGILFNLKTMGDRGNIARSRYRHLQTNCPMLLVRYNKFKESQNFQKNMRQRSAALHTGGKPKRRRKPSVKALKTKRKQLKEKIKKAEKNVKTCTKNKLKLKKQCK